MVDDILGDIKAMDVWVYLALDSSVYCILLSLGLNRVHVLGGHLDFLAMTMLNIPVLNEVVADVAHHGRGVGIILKVS